MSAFVTLIATFGFAVAANAVSLCPNFQYGTYFCKDRTTGATETLDVKAPTESTVPSVEFYNHNTTVDLTLNCANQTITLPTCTPKDRQNKDENAFCDQNYGPNTEAILMVAENSSKTQIGGAYDIETAPFTGSPKKFFASGHGQADSITTNSFHVVVHAKSTTQVYDLDEDCKLGQN